MRQAGRRVASESILLLTIVLIGSPVSAQCVGDCNGDGTVAIDELVMGMTIALESADLSQCTALDGNDSMTVTIDELVEAVVQALTRCGDVALPTPTNTTTRTPTSSSTPIPTATRTPTTVGLDRTIIEGNCRVPGKFDLTSCATGTGVTAYRCDFPENCLTSRNARTFLARDDVDTEGFFRIDFETNVLGDMPLLLLTDDLDPRPETTTHYRTLSFGRIGAGGLGIPTVDIDPVSEASAEVLRQENGLQDYTETGVRKIVIEVESANDGMSFAGADAEAAALLATETARSAPGLGGALDDQNEWIFHRWCTRLVNQNEQVPDERPEVTQVAANTVTAVMNLLGRPLNRAQCDQAYIDLQCRPGEDVCAENLSLRGFGEYDVLPLQALPQLETLTITGEGDQRGLVNSFLLRGLPGLLRLRLRSLDLTDDDIEPFIETPFLTELDLSGNVLEQFPQGLPSSIETLDLSDNAISRRNPRNTDPELVRDTFNDLVALVTLDIQEMRDPESPCVPENEDLGFCGRGNELTTLPNCRSETIARQAAATGDASNLFEGLRRAFEDQVSAGRPPASLSGVRVNYSYGGYFGLPVCGGAGENCITNTMDPPGLPSDGVTRESCNPALAANRAEVEVDCLCLLDGTPTPTRTATRTPTPIDTATSTPSNTPTRTPINTPTLTATAVPSPTATATLTPTSPPTPSPTVTPTPTATDTPTGGTCPSDMVATDLACVDRYEAPNQVGELPLVMYTLYEAEAWCADRGKRLCFDDEWESACEGVTGTAYPYGDLHQPGVCNDDETFIVFNQSLINAWPSSASSAAIDSLDELLATARSVSQSAADSADHIESLYQGETSGSNAGCASDRMIFDLTGNVEEWTKRRDGGVPGSSGNLKGRYWAESRTCQGDVTSHGDAFRFYYIGFRCCTDLG